MVRWGRDRIVPVVMSLVVVLSVVAAGVGTVGASAAADSSETTLNAVGDDEITNQVVVDGNQTSVTITAGGGVDASTFSSGAFNVTNTGTENISSLRITTNSPFLPDLVFDPNGTAGDVSSDPKGFTPDSGATTTGLDTFAYQDPHNGVDGEYGYDTLVVNFTDFESGETLTFSADMDPTSIHGVSSPGPNESGAVSGLELSGTAITVEYESGATETVTSFSDGSPGGGQATVRDNASTAPTLDVSNVSLESTTLSADHSAATVSDAGQTINVTGPAGAQVRLVRAEAGLFLDGVPDGGYELEAYEANSVVQVEEYTSTIGADGSVQIPVTLTNTVTANDSGLNYFVAAVEDSNGNTGQTSNVVVLDYDPDAGSPTLEPISDVSMTENETKTVGVTASDPDGDPITLSASGLPSFASFTDDGDGTGNLTLSPQTGDAGTYELTVTASDGELTDSQNVTVRVVENSTVLYRVNAGGSALTAVDDGPDWETDTSNNPSPYHNGVGETSDYSDQTIAVDGTVPASTPPAVFDSARWDPSGGEEMQWAFPVESGTPVEVRLYFVDAYSGTSEPGDRVFDVAIENETVLNDYDIVADVGPDTGTVKTFTVTSDGTIDIDFQHVTENPIVSGVEIVEPSPENNTLGASADSLEFGSVSTGESSTETIRFTNLGAESGPNITVEDTTITGVNASAFSDDFSGNVTLAPTQSTTINATFTPETDGAKSGQLEVTHTGENSPVVVNLTGTGDNAAPISFGSSDLSGATPNNPTSLEFGPDGRLYVSSMGGTIYAYNVTRNDTNDYTVSDTEVITKITDIPNHWDNGTLAPTVNGRQVTGILVTGTAENPVIYVSSSDPRIGGKTAGEDTNLDTNSGVISRLTWNGSDWEHVDIVRGLPRSEENHATNGMVLDEQNNTLLVAQGGNTGQGAPSNELAYLAEYAYSGAVLSVNLTQIEAMPTKTGADSGIAYKYDLPTLKDTSQPWGGQDGRNMAVFDQDGPVQVYAPGFRNVYDLTLTEDGQLYGVDNGGSKGWGAPPVNEGPSGVCTNEPNDGGEDDIDSLHRIYEGFYGGHPNPTRGNPDGAGIYDENGTLLVDFNSSYTPVPFDQAEARQCDYLDPGSEDDSLTTFSESTNGNTEYTASNFGGAMQGDILTVSFTNSGPVWRIQLNETGEEVVSKKSLFSNFGSLPLDITSQGDSDKFPGTVWVANFGSDTVTVFEPSDTTGCTGADDPTLDEDGDGYDNADEIDNGVDPCSAADTPPDWDGDLTSNLNDPDDDNDGINDTTDAFPIDADNGLTTPPSVEYNFETGSEPDTFFDAGFTGVMTNGTDYLDLYNGSRVTATGIAGVLSIDDPTGDAVTNNQTQAFQFGVNASDEPFTVHTRIENAFEDSETTEDFQSTGVFVGTGDQDNYTKLVANADDGNVSLVFAKEEGGTYQEVTTTNLGNVSDLPGSLELYLAVDPVNDTVTAKYSPDGGTTVVTVGETSIERTWHTDADRGLAVGVIATHTGVSYQATWDLIEVDLAGNQPPKLDPISNQSLEEDVSKTVAVSATDPDDGDTIDLSASNLPSFATFTDNGDGTGNLTLSPQRGDAGTYELTVSASDGNLTDSQNITVEVAENTSALYRVNAGGSSLTAIDDESDWSVDTASNPSPYHNGVGETSDYSDQTITVNGSVPASTPPEIFDSARWDRSGGEEMQWAFPVESGSVVEVRLYFVDAWSGTSEPGDRVFDVAIENETVLDDYDIVADVGPDTGTVKTFTVVSDGTVDVDFQHVTQNPIVSGIEIVTASEPGNQAPVLDSISDQTVEVNTTRTVEVTTSDPDGDPINLTASNLPAFATFTDDGDGTGNLTLAPQESDVGSYELTVSASDGNLTDSQNVTVNVTENQAPVLDSIPDQTVEENTTTTVEVTASDPDGDAINLSASNLPSFATFTDDGDGTGNLTLSPQTGDAGTYEFTVTASDGELTDSQTVAVEVAENVSILHRVNAGGSGLTAVDSGPDWDVDTSANPSPYHNGVGETSDYSDQTIAVNDSVPASTPLEIFDSARWDPSNGEEMQWAFPVESGTPVEVRLYFVDAYSGTSEPGDRVFDVAIENETVLNDYDIVADVGPDTGTMKSFTVTSDGTVDIDFQHVTENPIVSGIEIVRVDEPGNQAPVLASIADQTVEENTTTTVEVTASDPDGDAINLSASNLPAFATFTDDGDGTGNLTLAPQVGDVGSYELTVSASDGNLTDSQNVTVNVTENQAPVLEPVPNQTVKENTTTTVEVTASDPDGDAINLSASNLPSFATFTDDGDGTGNLTLAPQVGDTGTYELTITASDGELTDSQNVTVEVVENVSILHRVNAGGGSLTAVDDGSNWGVDTSANPSPYHNGVGETSDYSDQTIAVNDSVPASTPPEIFDSARWDRSGGEEMQWELPVESGTVVEVRLYFVDAYSGTSEPGDRVFDVAIENETVLNDYDIVADVGPDTGTMKNFTVVSDGTIDIDFQHVTQNPIVSGVEIVRVDEPGNQAPVLASIADQTVEENTTKTVEVTASDPDGDAVNLSASNLPAFATFTDDGDGTGNLTLAPQVGDAGIYELTVTASDGNLTDSQNVTVNVTENQAPVLDPIETQYVEENTTTTVEVTASDPDGDAINLTASNLPAFATFTDDGDGTGNLTLSPQVGDAGTYTVDITASDGQLGDTESVEVVVSENVTVLYRVNAGGPEQAALDTGPVWEVDTDSNPSPYHNSGSEMTDWSDTVTTTDGTVPASTPLEVFQYARWDPSSGEEMQWAFPVESGQQVEVRLYFSEGYTGTSEPGDRVFDVTIENETVLDDYDVVADVGFGNGTMKNYTVTSDGTVNVSFGHEVQNPAIAGIEIVAVEETNEAPTAQDDSASVEQGNSTTIDVLANDSDPDGTLDASTVIVTSGPSNGTVSVNVTTGEVTYTHDGSVTAADSFAYTVEDNDGATSNEATVSISVTSTNEAPTASDDSATVEQGNSTTIDVLANDSDPDGTLNVSSVSVTTGPSNGTVTVDSTTGEVTYTHDGTSVSSDSFGYTVDDDEGATSNEATVSVDVTSTNEAPTALDDSATVDQGNSTVIDVLANDSDPDGTLNASSVTVTSGPSNGTVSVDSTTGAVTYTHDGTSANNDSFTYTVDDDDGATSNEATVSITVTSTNEAPVASDDSATVDQGNSTVIDVLANDSDPDGTLDTSTVTVTNGPSNGTVSVNMTTGEVTYTHDGSATAADSFAYTVDDNDGATSNEATVSIDVTGTNEAPTALDDSASVQQGNSTTIDVLANDSDPDGTLNASTVIVTSGPSNGTVSVNATTGEVTYTHDGSSSTSDSFTYTVDDNDGATSNEATVSINVTSTTTNEAPTAQDDSAAVEQGNSTTIDVLANDSDPDGTLNASTVTITSDPSNGTVTVDSTTGAVTYTHDGSTSTSDAFSYTVDDDDGATSNEATVSITVTSTNEAPVASDDSATVEQGNSTTIDVLANDSDPDGTLNTSSVTVTSGPSNGTVSVDETTGAVTYTHDGSSTTSDSFTYTVADDDGAVSNEATVSVDVTSTNEAPTASDDSATVDQGNSTVIDVLANDDDTDGTLDTSSVTITSGPSNGTVSVDPDTGEVTYTHDGSSSTSDSFTYTVADDDGAVSNEATVAITVESEST